MNRITFGTWYPVPGQGLQADTFKNNHYIGITERNNNGLVYFDADSRLANRVSTCSDSIITLASRL